jgi:hypothetical protein
LGEETVWGGRWSCSPSPQPSPQATVLIGKLKVFIFKQMIHEDDEFAHAGGHGDERFFTGGEESGIKGFEDAVMADGAQGGHVEGATHGASPATDMAPAFKFPAVAIVGGDARQGGGRLRVKFAEFGHFCQHGGRHDRTDTGDGFQPFGFPGQFRIGGNEGGDGLVTFIDLFFQQFEQLAVLAQAERIGVMVGAIGFHGAGMDELTAALGHGRQLPLLGRKPGRHFGFEVGAIVGEDGGIDGIGFGAPALGPGEVTDAAGFDDADGNIGGLKRQHDRLFIAAGGFTNDVRSAVRAQQFEELGMTFGIIGEGVETAGEVELQRKLGNIEADMEDGYVLTHTCKDTSPGDWEVAVLKQRFEFRTMGTRETGLETHHAQAYARRGRFRARRCPPACRPEGSPSLACFRKPAKQDDWNIQGEGETISASLGICLVGCRMRRNLAGAARQRRPTNKGLEKVIGLVHLDSECPT